MIAENTSLVMNLLSALYQHRNFILNREESLGSRIRAVFVTSSITLLMRWCVFGPKEEVNTESEIEPSHEESMNRFMYTITLYPILLAAVLRLLPHKLSDPEDEQYEAIMANFPNIEKVKVWEIRKLLDTYSKYQEKIQPLGIPATHEDFLNFLKQSCHLSELLTLVHLGANEKDCYISIFEKADAASMRVSPKSLTWLCAKQVARRMSYGYKLPAETPEEIKEIISMSKKYLPR